MEDIARLRSSRRTYDQGQVETFVLCKDSISFYREGFQMHCVKSMPSAFKNMSDDINMWRAVIVNDFFYDSTDMANDETTWNIQCAPEYLINDLDRGLDAECHAFILDRYRDELSSTREI